MSPSAILQDPEAEDIGASVSERVRVQIAGIGTAIPKSVSQEEALRFVLTHFNVKDRTRSLYEKTFGHPSIRTRHFAVERLEQILDRDHDRINARFEAEAVRLSKEALDKALRAAHRSAMDIDFLVVATCTGYLCPALSNFVADVAGLRPDVAHADNVGMGCGAAIPSLEQAFHFVSSRPGSTAAVICAEICSAAMFSNDDPDIVISNSLFSDGAAALVIKSIPAGEAHNGLRLPEILSFESLLVPAWREEIRFRTQGGLLKNVLAKELPDHAATAFRQMTETLLRRNNLRTSDVDQWILHPGGARVLDRFKENMNLSEAALRSARAVLSQHGNMSSPTVLFVLQEEMRSRPPKRGALGVMSAFGAGFSAYAALLRF